MSSGLFTNFVITLVLTLIYYIMCYMVWMCSQFSSKCFSSVNRSKVCPDMLYFQHRRNTSQNIDWTQWIRKKTFYLHECANHKQKVNYHEHDKRSYRGNAFMYDMYMNSKPHQVVAEQIWDCSDENIFILTYNSYAFTLKSKVPCLILKQMHFKRSHTKPTCWLFDLQKCSAIRANQKVPKKIACWITYFE